MKKLIPVFFVFFSCSANPHDAGHKNHSLPVAPVEEQLRKKDISDPTNVLTGKTERLKLRYIVWGCACANWITPSDFTRLKSDHEDHCIFIEPASKALEIPADFNASRDRILVEGQFYVRPDYPKGTIQGEEQLDKARVFRYTKMRIIRR